MARFTGPIRSALAALREALANDGIRRLEIAWMLGIAADTALLVVLLVVVYERDGIVATGLLGAVRMAPAVVAGMLSGAILQRFRGDRILLGIGLTRAAAAALCALVIATDGPTPLLFLLAALATAAGAPVRPTQATLMPALARSPSELVAANMAWSTGEGIAGLGMVSGSLLAPLLIAAFGTRGALSVSGAILPIIALIIYSRIGRADRITVVDERTVHLLREVPAFAELPLTAVERLATGLVPVTFATGDMVMRQGEDGDEFIVVDTGEIEVSVDGRVTQRLGHGSGVGEIALLRRSPRTATVIALTEVTGYSVASTTFLAAIAGPASAAVTERMAEANLARGGATG